MRSEGEAFVPDFHTEVAPISGPGSPAEGWGTRYRVVAYKRWEAPLVVSSGGGARLVAVRGRKITDTGEMNQRPKSF